ncbi:MAG: hypothetical protein NTZ05_14590 [Chloroflexi bacterium]|nr:hypothetical protein [Chloroflexota bacterium]
MTIPTPPTRSTTVQDELRLHLDSLHDLGPAYADDLAASFMRKLDIMIDAKVEARLAERGIRRFKDSHTATLAITLGLGIPLTAISGGMAGFPGMLIVWLGLILITYFPPRRQ